MALISFVAAFCGPTFRFLGPEAVPTL
ncbi:uncharacterized protein METZ01_LOCUS406583 [marine metagenome]|uniref:Uncharacterized protein n=1 Tax=marine metagenome TaxID=408172 RepID=A0A382W4Q8_9ZZZZ